MTVAAFCIFLGYPRSGHSIVGSLIDAHPQAAIAHELNALQLVQEGASRDDLFASIQENARAAAGVGRPSGPPDPKHGWTTYSYEVPGLYQGRSTDLRVIGDKDGPPSTRRLTEDPAALDALERVVGVPVRMIHVLRSPYDNITSMSLKGEKPIGRTTHRYFQLADGVRDLRERLGPAVIFDIAHEDLVADPVWELRRLCQFLGLEADAEYLEGCRRAVFGGARRTRDSRVWTKPEVDAVAERLERYPFLTRYAQDRHRANEPRIDRLRRSGAAAAGQMMGRSRR